MTTIPLTRRGSEKLREELARLKTVERHAVIQASSEARAQGELSENAEYEAAKDKQGFSEGRSQEIESKLAAAQVIDPASIDADGRVVFGSPKVGKAKRCDRRGHAAGKRKGPGERWLCEAGSRDV